MKTVNVILVAVLTAATFFCSCAKRDPDPACDVQLKEIVLKSLPSGAKTCLGVDGKSVLWQPGDEISVLDGFGNRCFVTKEGGEVAEFGGAASSVSGLIIAYPYDASSSRDGDCITLEVPTAQIAVPGTFDRTANVTLAKANDNGEFFALNLCAMIRLSVTREDILSVRISSQDQTPLSGRVCVAFDKDGVPFVQSVPVWSDYVDIDPSDSETLAPGTYYIPVLPAQLEAGLKITLNLEKDLTAVRLISDPVSLVRSRFTDVIADENLSYEKDEERIVVIYGDSITHINVFNHLQSLLDTKAGDIQDVDTLKHVTYRVVQAGRSGERPIQIAARQGALPLYIKGPFKLNAKSTVSTTVGEGLYTSWNEEAEDLGSPDFLLNVDYGGESTTGWTGCTNPFVVDGIPCSIKSTSAGTSSTGVLLNINRVKTAKEDVDFTENYIRVQTHVDHDYGKPYISTVYMGTNGKYVYQNPADGHTWAQLGDFIQAMLDHAPDTKWVVCGYHSTSRWTQGGVDYLSGRFGDLFLDLHGEGIRKVADINSQIGYSLTQEDQEYLNKNEWPAGWQDLSNKVHPSPVGHKAYATLLFEKMEELGYF